MSTTGKGKKWQLVGEHSGKVYLTGSHLECEKKKQIMKLKMSSGHCMMSILPYKKGRKVMEDGGDNYYDYGS